MSVEGVNTQKDVRHVILKMTQAEQNLYMTFGWPTADGKRVLKQPPGIDIIWYGREPTNPFVSATFFTSKVNPDPTQRKTGEDIDEELSYLPVVSDTLKSGNLVEHPYLRVDTLLNNPQLDYNKGELDFLRSKPVKGHTEWKPKSQIDDINNEFKRQQKLLGEPEKLLKIDESKAVKGPTGEKYYPFEIAQVTKGGDKEHDGAKESPTSGGVGPHMQEVSNGLHTAQRWYDPSKPEKTEEVRLSGR